MTEKKIQRINKYALALSIGILPPLWAVLAPYIGVSVGAGALVCAGVYVANGNKRSDALKIIIGFLLGDLWAVTVVLITDMVSLNPNIVLFFTLFILGILAVLIGETFSKYIFLPSWLCGWALGLVVMGPMKFSELHSMPFQIAVAMIVGVLYIGICVDAFQKLLVKLFTRK